MTALLEVEGLRVRFPSPAGPLHAVDDVSFTLARGATLGIVGESGSGKSVTALALMRLLASPPARISATRLVLDGTDLLAASEAEMRALRGRDVAMVFQDPMTALNPVLTVGRQLTEVLETHMGLAGAAARQQAIRLLDQVGIPAAAQRIDEHPHRFSGGMRQRVMIAIAIACRPKLLIADEPTTALDVTVQAQILDLLRGLQRELGMAMILITHDLGVVAGMADALMVMYGGRQVEMGPTEAVFAAPRMPYTAGLIGAVPRLDRAGTARLQAIRGTPPEPLGAATACRFAPRCDHAAALCEAKLPPLRRVGPAHLAACHFAEAAPP
jgi:oligopeptide transport system ATP-binding protein